jgi:carboxymethylenebutenolidase
MKTIDRSTFVGGSAAILAATQATPADAQSMDFGKPHPPIVPENDPAITTMHISLVRPDATIGAYVAMPKSITATTPGIVMSAHIWGIDAQYRDMARRFAKLGYIVIGPGIFDRSNPPNGDGQTDTSLFAPAVAALYAGNLMTGDLLAGHDWIRSKAPRSKIGLYGNCMGGGIALQAAAASGTAYAAVCELYGYVRADRKTTQPPPAAAFAWAPNITAATIGFYGGADTSISTDDVRAAFAAIAGPHNVVVYPDAPHAFLDDTRGAYRPGPATDAWAQMTAWYQKYLMTP